MKADLLKLLEYIFKSSEFNVRKSGPNGILIEQNGYKAFVMCSLQGDYEEIKNFSKKTDENTGIYVISQKATQEFNEYAKSLRVNLWDRDELALQAGRALLQNMEKKAGIFPSPELPQTSELSQAPELPLEKADFELGLATLEERESKTESFELKAAPEEGKVRESLASFGEFRNEREAEIQENGEKLSREAYDILNIKSIEPRVSKEQAFKLAKGHLSRPRTAVLKFVPFWKYSYSVETERRIRAKILSIVGDGKGYLNALNKRKEELDIGEMEIPIRVPPVEYEVKSPMLEKNEARKNLMDSIIEEYTREMRFNNTKGQAIIYEQKCIKPKPEDIELQMELVYVPIWEIKGKRNSLELNACTAHILEEPVDEDAEFL